MLVNDSEHSYIALELCDYTLEKLISRKEVKDVTKEDWWKTSFDLIGDLLCGLEHMHTQNMLHRDLKVGLTCVHFMNFTSRD